MIKYMPARFVLIQLNQSIKQDTSTPKMNIDSSFGEALMWERMMDAGLLVAGAVALFAAFTTILFVYERREDKKQPARHPQLRVIRCEKSDKAA